MDAFYEAARLTYGDLAQADFTKIGEMIERCPYEPLMGRLAQYGHVVEREINSRHDDVALAKVLASGAESCVVWLSYVGPYAVSG